MIRVAGPSVERPISTEANLQTMVRTAVDPAGQCPSARLVFLGLLVAAVSLRLILAAGFQARDDRSYATYAYILATESRVPLEHSAQWLPRIGHWIPVAATIKVLGVNELSMALYPLACSTAGFLLVWRLGRLLFNELTALLGAILLGFMPLDVIWSTHAYPDMTLGFWLVLTLYLFLCAERSPHTRWPLYLATGLTAGLAYLHREEAAYLVAPFACYIGSKRVLRRQYWLVVLGGIAVVAAEWCFWTGVADDPLYRYRVLTGRIDDAHDTRGQEANPDTDSWTWQSFMRPGKFRRGDNPWTEPALVFSTDQEFGLFYYFIWPVVLIRLIKRGPAQILAMWVLSMTLMLCYFPIAFPNTLVRNARYFNCLTIPAVLLLADWLIRLRPAWRWSITGLLVSSSLVCVYLDSSRFAMDHVRAIHTFMREHPEDRFWLSPRDRIGLFFVAGVHADTKANAHLLTTGRGSDNFQNLMMLCPDIAVADDLDAIDEGFVVVQQSEPVNLERQAQLESRCELVHTIQPGRGAMFERLIELVERTGVPKKMARRLMPNLGERTEIWRVTAPNEKSETRSSKLETNSYPKYPMFKT